jgi:hypothetical protein
MGGEILPGFGTNGSLDRVRSELLKLETGKGAIGLPQILMVASVAAEGVPLATAIDPAVRNELENFYNLHPDAFDDLSKIFLTEMGLIGNESTPTGTAVKGQVDAIAGLGKLYGELKADGTLDLDDARKLASHVAAARPGELTPMVTDTERELLRIIPADELDASATDFLHAMGLLGEHDIYEDTTLPLDGELPALGALQAQRISQEVAALTVLDAQLATLVGKGEVIVDDVLALLTQAVQDEKLGFSVSKRHLIATALEKHPGLAPDARLLLTSLGILGNQPALSALAIQQTLGVYAIGAAPVAYQVRQGPLYGPSGKPSPMDVSQGLLGDCFGLAAFISASNTNAELIQNAIEPIVNETTSEVTGYKVKLYKNVGTRDAPDFRQVEIVIDNQFPTFLNDNGMIYAASDTTPDIDPGEVLWVPVLEKALAVLRSQTGSGGAYDSIGLGGLAEGLEALLGQKANLYLIGESKPSLLDFLTAALEPANEADRKVLIAGTYADSEALASSVGEPYRDPITQSYETSGILPRHAYGVAGVVTGVDGTTWVTLKNTYGDQEPSFSTNDDEEDGLFNIPLADFQQLFQAIFWTPLPKAATPEAASAEK